MASSTAQYSAVQRVFVSVLTGFVLRSLWAIVAGAMRKAVLVLKAESELIREPRCTRKESSGDAKIPADEFALRFVKRE